MKQLTLFESQPHDRSQDDYCKIRKAPLLEGNVYLQMPQPKEHPLTPSVDPTNERGWTMQDWQLYLKSEHPHIKKKLC